jgi:hypothetical protein
VVEDYQELTHEQSLELCATEPELIEYFNDYGSERPSKGAKIHCIDGEGKDICYFMEWVDGKATKWRDNLAKTKWECL